MHQQQPAVLQKVDVPVFITKNSNKMKLLVHPYLFFLLWATFLALSSLFSKYGTCCISTTVNVECSAEFLKLSKQHAEISIKIVAEERSFHYLQFFKSPRIEKKRKGWSRNDCICQNFAKAL